MPSIKLDNGVRAEDLDAAIAADKGESTPAPKKEAPAPKAKAAAKPETPKTSE
tara:strand:+ start:89 stop:247 length:159 start_codon:yes stop_codon:yes gene_type:complete